MLFKDHSVAQVLVGLHRIGIAGLHGTLRKAGGSGLQDREELVNLIVDDLASKNYIADSQVPAFRTAVWREYLRFRGEDFSAFFSEIPVTVRGPAGEERDEMVTLLRSVLADLELRPVIAYAAETAMTSKPELLIRDKVVAHSPQSRRSLEKAIRQSLSAW